MHWGVNRMLTRRSFVAALCGLMSYLAMEASAEAWKEWMTNFLSKAVRLGLANVDQILYGLLRVVTDVKILTGIRDRAEDVRRKLTDSTPEHHLNVKLAEWLKNYDAWAIKPNPGENDAVFKACVGRERDALQSEWKDCNRDAIDALKEIENLGIELESIDPGAISSEEWRVYKSLLDDEKMVITVINADMPTDPASIDRLREVAEQLGTIVTVIDKQAANPSSVKNAL
jgi:hypothetical protein